MALELLPFSLSSYWLSSLNIHTSNYDLKIASRFYIVSVIKYITKKTRSFTEAENSSLNLFAATWWNQAGTELKYNLAHSIKGVKCLTAVTTIFFTVQGAVTQLKFSFIFIPAFKM